MVQALCGDSILPLHKLTFALGHQEVGKVNMNALGDDHVSFSAAALAMSPNGRYLAVSTDGPRIVVMRTDGACYC